MKKRMLSMLLMLCMVVSLLPGTAFAAEGDTAETPDQEQCAHLLGCGEEVHDVDCPLYADSEEIPTKEPAEGVIENEQSTSISEPSGQETPEAEDGKPEPYADTSAVYVSATATNENPVGTQDAPFKTVQAAYDAVPDGGTIYLLTDIEIAEDDVITFFKAKSVTLTSADDETHRIYAKENLDLNQVDPYECLLVIGRRDKDAASNDNLSGPTITLKNITLDGNNQNVRGIQHYGGTLVLDAGAKVCNASYVHPDKTCGPNDWGGGIVVDLGAKLVMNAGSEIYNCTAEWGGGVYLSGVMEMNGGRICNNTAVGDHYEVYNGKTTNANGGGIAVCAFRADLADQASNSGAGAKLSINGGSITGNAATSEINAFGGGICVLGSLYGLYHSDKPFTGTSEININGGTISDNSASHGAGIMVYARQTDYCGNAKISMTGGAISDNTATYYGGGVCLWSSAAGNTSEFHMSDGQIMGNQAVRADDWGDLTEGSGGGVFLYGEGDKFYMTDGAISDNQAGDGGGLTISSSNNKNADAYLLGGTISGNKALGGYPTSTWYDGDRVKYEGNAVLQKGNLYLDGTSTVIDGDIRLPYVKGMGGKPATNHVVSLVGAGENMNEYFLTSWKSESMDGRPVVVPGTCFYGDKTYQVEDAEPYMGQFFHNWKGIIPGTKYTELTNDGSENAKSLVLYETYTLKYEYDGAVPENAPALPKTVNAWPGAEVSVAAAPTMNGWKFSGWTVKSPDGMTIQDGKLTMPNVDVVLSGSWSPLYTVTYDLNGGDANGKDYSTVTVDSGEKVTAKDAPVRNGYAFTGWSGSDGKDYHPGDVLTVTGNITLTAQWRKTGGGGGESTTYYILHYESNGGTKYKDERYAKNTVVQLDKVPVREGYQFTGWYADKGLTERITSIKMTSDKTVYAGWRKATVPDMLNGDDHFAYVIGYTDGTVRPNANISRSEVAAIFFRLLKPEVRDGNLTSFNTFTDVNEGMWCNKSISTMAALNIVKGRSAERFDPDAPITRAEFAAICARFDTGMTEGDSNFTDISGHWAEAEIERAASLGWIMGYTDGTFRPDNYITRAEAMTMINRVLCRIPEDEDDLLPGMNVWPDNQPGAWYYLAVQEATNSHDFQYKGEIYEHWIKLTTDPDWTRYQD